MRASLLSLQREVFQPSSARNSLADASIANWLVGWPRVWMARGAAPESGTW